MLGWTVQLVRSVRQDVRQGTEEMLHGKPSKARDMLMLKAILQNLSTKLELEKLKTCDEMQTDIAKVPVQDLSSKAEREMKPLVTEEVDQCKRAEAE